MKTIKRGMVKARQINLLAMMLLGFLIVSGAAFAQGDPRSNVNVIGMTPDPDDIPDTYYRQQNEPACAIRPGDSACIICAYNDYRGVDFPVGDSWQGVSQSCDAGDTWRSRLAPGHPGDIGVDLIPAEFAADPRLVAIPGMAIFNFIAGFRDSNVGVLGIQHWLEVTKEDADHWEPARTTWIADTGTSGRFLDKPDILFLMDPLSQQSTIRLTTEMENTGLSEHPDPGQAVPGFITRDFPTGTLYAAYAVFTGSNSIKVLVKTSSDLGRTWKNQVLKLSEDQNEVSGISLTAVGDKVLAVWRRKGDNNDPDSILYSIISNGGKKATKGEVLADICAFDQPTLTGTEILDLVEFKLAAFRTNDFPWAANDSENLFVFYSDRGRDDVTGACLENEPPRIVMHYSTDVGQSWNANPVSVDTTSASEGSFQFMPTAFGANGKVQIAYYDTQREEPLPLEVPLVADYEFLETLVQRTVDVYTTNVTLQPGNGQSPPVLDIPDPVRVSQFSIIVNESGERFESEASFANSKLFAQGKAPFLGDYIAMAAREFRQITSGPNEGKWESNAFSSGGNEDFFAAWTSNRDVSGTIPGISEPSGYTKPANAVAENREDTDSADEMTEKPMLANSRPIPETGPPRDSAIISEGLDGSDPSAVPAVCTPNVPTPVTNERSRDANIYGSLIKDQVRLYAPTPAKPLGGVVRAFVVALSNSDTVPRTYDLEIVPGNCDGAFCKASFRQIPSKPPFGGNVLSEPGIAVPAKSTLARTVFIAGDQPPVTVEAYEGTSLIATIKLGNSPSFEDPENCPDLDSSCAVATSELHNLELQTVDARFLASLIDANLLNADLLSSPLLVDFAVAGGCCEGEDPPTVGSVIDYVVNLDLAPDDNDISATETNAALLNAALLNANLLNANLLNANLLNAALLNANLLNAPLDGNFEQDLIDAAIAGGVEEPLTVGSLLLFAADPSNGVNAALLNAALLNAALLNANLLNANLLNANLLNANLLNANLLNQNPANAALLNAALLNANLLNASVSTDDISDLLNADLLNANLLNPSVYDLATEGGCCDDEIEPTIGSILLYAVGHPETINAALLNASLLNANLLNANLLNANLLNANLLNANLLNANLVDTGGTDASLLNADLINADFVNANLLNTAVLDDVSGDVTYDDYTYPLTNNGNVTTAIDLDITITAPTTEDGELDIIATKLMTWTANATPTVVDCIERVQLNTRVQSITGIDGNFEVADIDDPFAGQVSAVVAAGETVLATLRVIGTRAQLKNVRVNAFTASSQAANCFPDPDNAGSFICDDELTQGDEQIVFEDTTPPVITVPGELVVEATSPIGANVNYLDLVTVVDDRDANPTLTCMPESGELFYLGGTIVSCYAEDAAGNRTPDSAEFNVEVVDSTPPNAPDVADITEEATGPGGATVSWTYFANDVATLDPIPADCTSTDTALTSGQVFSIGVYSFSCTATDGATPPNTGAASTFTITVADTTPPGPLDLPDPITLDAESSAGTPYSWDPVTAFDAASVGGFITAVCMPASGSIFPLGVTTTVFCTATDGAGLTSSGSFTVTVEDQSSPAIDPVVPANGFTPDTLPFNLDADANTITITWPVNVDDVDPNLDIRCYIGDVNGMEVTRTSDPAPITTSDGSERISASFSNLFSVGETDIVCAATDTNGTTEFEFTVAVFDITPPEIVIPLVQPTQIELPGILPDGTESFEFDYGYLVSATDAVDDSPTLECRTDPADNFGSAFVDIFSYGDTTVECQAEDASGNLSTADFVIRARYLYDIDVILPKGRAKAGSTIPIDVQYSDWESPNLPVDSSSIPISISWASTDDCATPNGDITGGDDSGDSKWRYMMSDMIWQYSWQTKDEGLIAGDYLVIIDPPGVGVADAVECVTLR